MLCEESKKIRKKVGELGISALTSTELLTFASMHAHIFRKTVTQADDDGFLHEICVSVFPIGRDAIEDALRKAGVVPLAEK